MVDWTEQGPIRVIFFWADNLLCIWHLIGFIFTIILFNEFRFSHSPCDDSFFAYNYHEIVNNVTTLSCHLTSKGEHITYTYFVFNGIGLMIYLYAFYRLILLKTFFKDLPSREIPSFCFLLCVIPIYICSLVSTIYSMVYPKIFLISDSLHYFHRLWMGYTRQAWTSWLILIAQTAYLIENSLELAIIIGVFSSHFNTHFSRVYLSFALINIVARVFVFGIRFLQLLLEYTGENLRICWVPTDYTRV